MHALPSPTAAPPLAGGLTPSAVEYVRALRPEDKHAVLLVLLREAAQRHRDPGPLPIEDEAGKPFGYYVPPTAPVGDLLASMGIVLTEEDHERTRRALADLDNTFDIHAFLNQLSREDAEPGR